MILKLWLTFRPGKELHRPMRNQTTELRNRFGESGTVVCRWNLKLHIKTPLGVVVRGSVARVGSALLCK
jgi:hypothetical protein